MSESSEHLASRFRSECESDAVGNWQIVKAVRLGVPPEQASRAVVAIVRSVLADGRVSIGQFERGRFIPWSGTVDDRLNRVAAEMGQLEGHVDIGDIGWLVVEP